MADFLQILKQYWGYDQFRGVQRDIIESIYAGKDTLGLMPTGGGKSIAFQVPCMAMEGICLVITPLISLMKDQVFHLREKGIKTEAIYSGMSREQILIALENCILGDRKFLYVSPERLHSDLFQAKLKHMNVCFITIDEAHCISQWGYDFRPSYLEIARIREILPGKPVLALTATATRKVAKDIQEKLGFARPNVLRMSFERKNLKYIVRQAEDKYQETLNILNRTQGSSIIYVRNRKRTREIAEWLKDNHIEALHYHAGLDNIDRDIRQNMWQDETVRVIVATNAFGMGIDKSNVRLVIHLDTPDSPEAYFQEAGRAGRDGETAEAILLYNGSDKSKLLKKIEEKFPPKDYIRKVYEDICCFYQLAIGDGENLTYEFNETTFCKTFHYFPVPLVSSLRILSKAGYITYRDEGDSTSRIMFTLYKEELYRLHSMSQQSEKVIQAILRNYGGVFTEYVFIEEKDIALHTDLTPDAVYNTLIALNHQGILHYIPRKNIAYITFRTRRVETEEIVLDKEVYENRKQEYTKRINAMMEYITNTTICRSRMLLHYFDEEDIHDCGQCDVCHNRKPLTKEYKNKVERAAEAIIHTLSDCKEHPVHSVLTLPFDTEIIKTALQWLIDEEEVTYSEGMISLN